MDPGYVYARLLEVGPVKVESGFADSESQQTRFLTTGLIYWEQQNRGKRREEGAKGKGERERELSSLRGHQASQHVSLAKGKLEPQIVISTLLAYLHYIPHIRSPLHSKVTVCTWSRSLVCALIISFVKL